MASDAVQQAYPVVRKQSQHPQKNRRMGRWRNEYNATDHSRHTDLSTDHILQLRNVHTHIGEYHILQGVDFDVPRVNYLCCWPQWRWQIHSVCAPSWDLARQPRPDLLPRPTNSTTRDARYRPLEMAYVPENMSIFSALTVQENLRRRHKVWLMKHA